MAYLITPTLYNSYLYYAKGDFDRYEDKADEYREKARLDFLNTLNKVKIEPTEAMILGQQFEDAVFKCTQGVNIDDPCVVEIANLVKGGIWQETLSKRVGDYLFYGRSDVILADTIYDIKRSPSYEVGKYEQSIQHLVYLECSPISKFKYLVCDGKNVYIEDYTKAPNNLDVLMGRTNEMVAFINATPEFKEAFNKNWVARGA